MDIARVPCNNWSLQFQLLHATCAYVQILINYAYMHVPIIPELCLLPRSAYYSKNYASILGTRLVVAHSMCQVLCLAVAELDTALCFRSANKELSTARVSHISVSPRGGCKSTIPFRHWNGLYSVMRSYFVHFEETLHMV